ncbi:MAG TPA: phosphoribosyltransferase family protein [Nakamurella sp.]|nr:phosphoribosyltransferase family protein [Nakamurella sp.]
MGSSAGWFADSRAGSFADRREAGRRLGALLAAGRWAAREPARVVLGLPRGGVPVAAEVAAALSAGEPAGVPPDERVVPVDVPVDVPVEVPLDVLLVRKLGTPGQPELAMGAIGEDGVVVANPWVRARGLVDPAGWDAVLRRERAALADRAARYRSVRPAVPLLGRTAVVVDDGIATGATARAACAVARARGAAAVVLATPVIARSTARELRDADPPVADDVVAVLRPEGFGGVGQFYRDFSATTDREVLEILREAAAGR